MFGLSLTHIIVLIVVVVLLFSKGKISSIMEDLGGGMRALKRGLSEVESEVKETESEAKRLLK